MLRFRDFDFLHSFIMFFERFLKKVHFLNMEVEVIFSSPLSKFHNEAE